MDNKKWIGLSLLIIGIALYTYFDPVAHRFFPKCPFLSLTGYQCPGCGSQRAIHQLLQGNLAAAMQYNPLFVCALPYIFIGVLFERPSLKNKYLIIQRILFGAKTIYLIFGLIIAFWLIRNIGPWDFGR